MKVKDLINLTFDKNKGFIDETIKINIYSGKLYSKFIIFAGLILGLIHIFLYYSHSIGNFKVNIYLIMHLTMVGVNIIYLIFLNRANMHLEGINKIKFILESYVVFNIVWGLIASLIDEKFYGQIMMVYMVNTIACSFIYYIDNKKLLFLCLNSIFVLFWILTYFEQSKYRVLGYYVNGTMTIFFSYITSKILYKNLYSHFKIKTLMIEANQKLENEIEEIKLRHKQLEKVNKTLKKLSLCDELTNVNNRRALREFIDSKFSNIQQPIPVSIIMMDIDNFKLYNDKYGHIKGDEVLKKISNQLNGTLRDSRDFIARYGGEEFIYIALETDENEIYAIANRIREKVYNLKIINEYSTISNYVTISLGTATIFPRNENSIYECIKNADSALYKAKFEGKNKIIDYK